MKNKSLPIDKFISIIKEEYIYLNIIPHKSIRNYNSANIAKTIALSYKSLNKLIRIENKKLIIKNNFKVSYIIELKDSQANFYFIVPKIFKDVMTEKLKEIWEKATIEETEPLQPLAPNTSSHQLYYSKLDALSLNTDRRTNEPLNSILNVLDIMQDEDRVLISYNMNPTNQKFWSIHYDDIIKDLENNRLIDKDKKNKGYLLKAIGNAFINIIEAIFETLNDLIPTGQSVSSEELMKTLRIAFEEKKELSKDSKLKKNDIVVDTEIIVSSTSNDETRKYNNLKTVCDSYNILDGDNKLVHKEVENIKDFTAKNWGCIMNTFSSTEISNFIQIPARELLNKFKLKHINTQENNVPPQLQCGTKSLGICTYKGTQQEAFLDTDWQISNLPLLILGQQGSGKSCYITNYVNYCSKANESTIVIDYIKGCEVSQSIEKTVDKSKLVVLDLTKEDNLQSFAYNEIKIDDSLVPYERVKLASLQSQQLLSLVDSINIDTPLKPRMRKYISSASTVMFSLGFNSLKDVVTCLENCQMRKLYINSIQEDLKSYLLDEIRALAELDVYTKPTKKDPVPILVENKDSKIEGILDRINLLKEDFKLKQCFNKSPEDNIDFIDIMDNHKTLLIKMPEFEFPTKQHKNILTTFFISKIWLASQIRGSKTDKPSRVNLIIDELFQAKNSMSMVTYIAPQSRKYALKIVLTGQYLSQLKELADVMEACGSSTMLLKGVSEKDFSHYKSKIEGFEYEDLVDMPNHSSINIIYSKDGKFHSFLTKLPKPI